MSVLLTSLAYRSLPSLGRSLLVALSLGLPLLPAAALAQNATPSADARQRYSIPAGPLEAALNRFGQQARILLSFSPELVKDQRSPGLNGSYTVADGLQQLLAGTALQARANGQGGYQIQPAASRLAPIDVNADVPASSGAMPVPVYAGGQVASGGRVGVLGDMDMMEAPFNITAYTAELVDDQQARSVADILVNNSAAVRLTGARGDLNDSYTIRGFPVNNHDVALNGVYGLLPYWRVPIEFAERVELIRGPNALLNGMAPSGSVGGAINVVPKRAAAQPLTRLSVDYTSDSQVGTHVDAGRRFGDEKRFGVRFNGVYRQGDTALEDQSREFPLMTLALDYQGERLRLSSDLLFQKEKLNGVIRPIQVAEGVSMPDAPDSDRLFGMKNSYSDAQTLSIANNAEYDFNDHLTGFLTFGGRENEWDTEAANVVVTDGDSGASDFGSARQRAERRTLVAQTGLRGRFATGAVNHQWSLSVNRLKHREGVVYDFGAPVTGNLYAPAKDLDVDYSSLDGHIPTTQEYVFSGLTLTDRLLMLDDRLQLTLGARRQWIKTDNYDQKTGAKTSDYNEQLWTPLIGLAVMPLNNLTFYANAIQGLSPGDAAPLTASNPGTILAPYKTKQFEVGAKYDSGRFGATLAAFQIKKPSAYVNSDNVFKADGEQRNRGVEVSLFGEPVNGLRVLSGLSYIQPRLTDTEGGDNNDNDAPGVSRKQANLGLDWDLSRQISLGARWIYTGEAYLDAANTRTIPDWHRVDLGARYRLNLSGTPVVLRANLENAFGEDYWQGASGYEGVNIGVPRTLTLSVTVDL
ncbi:TonB-dependent siderophore receptor [Alloalcanivorax xenomutans]|uniref:TonB-dependent siderophore receptor n=1 Tax=Alloalcanivorax xenomutans TaxID=1094342 RepID=UPI003BAAB837